MVFNYSPEDIGNARPGDIIKLGGQRYRLRKKTNYSIAVDRYYWYDAAIEKVFDFLWRVLP
jgi:hypothetical protein